MPALRQREPGFAGLAAIVCGQQLSTASAGAIWARLIAAFDPFDHDAIRKAAPTVSDGSGFPPPRSRP
jgi:DNA-3-methyladenine glycosylase II